jgi:16S rRNA (guanine527-N7)-methyltransferase
MAKRLGLNNVTARQARAEEVRDRFNFITGRSVTAMPRFVGWVHDKLVPLPEAGAEAEGRMPRGGILYIKGGITEENQVEDLGGFVPTARYAIKEMLGEGIYDGDKAVLHFTPDDIRRGMLRARKEG